MKAATLRGSQYAFGYPDEAIAILRKTNPEIDADMGKEELVDTRQLALTDEVKAHGLGYIDAEHMETARNIVTPSPRPPLASARCSSSRS